MTAATRHRSTAAGTARTLQRLEAENRRLRRARKALLGVQQASAAVASRLEPREALQQIVNEALKVVGGDSAAILLVSDDQRQIEAQAVAGKLLPAMLGMLPRFTTRTRQWRMLCRQNGLVVHDAEASSDISPGRRYVRKRGVKSVLAVPLRARGRILGIIALASLTRKRGFSQADLRVIRLFAEQAALALDNSQLYAEARNASAQLRSQVDLGKAVFEGIRDPLALLNPEDRITFGNRALFAALGREPNQVIGHRWDEFVDPADADAIRAQAEATAGSVLTSQVFLREADGSRVPYIVSAGESRDSSGRLIGTVAVMVNFEGQGGLDGELLRSHRMVAAMRRLTRAVSRAFDVAALAAQALRSATGLLGVETGAVYLVEGDELVLVVDQNMGVAFRTRARRLPLDGSAGGHVALTRQPRVFADIRRSPRVASAVRKVVPPEARSGVIIPIPGRDSAIGTFALAGPDPAPFTRAAVGALGILAGQFGAALENVRLYEAARRRAERLAALSQAADQLISCTEPAQVVGIVCGGLAQVLGVKRVLCLDHDGQKGILVAIGGHNIPASRLRRLPPVRLGEAPVLALAVKEREPVLSADVRKQNALPVKYREVLGLGAVIAVPVISRKELCGLLVADNDGAPLSMNQDEKDMAMALANQTAITLDNIYLLREERARSQQLGLAVQEAHHRIKNNLQAVCDLLDLELMEAGGSGAAGGIERSIERVRAISLVHEFLSRHHDVATVNVGQVLERLVPLVVAGHQGREHQVTLSIKAAPLTLSSKHTTAVALIVNELVSNAVRHGLSDGKPGAVDVRLGERNGAVQVQVTDNGCGLPEGFDLRAHGHVGLEIARVLAERDLRGTIMLARRRGRAQGTVARVRFPR